MSFPLPLLERIATVSRPGRLPRELHRLPCEVHLAGAKSSNESVGKNTSGRAGDVRLSCSLLALRVNSINEKITAKLRVSAWA